MLRPLLIIALLLSSTARAGEFDLQRWLDEPGVRAVAVEFYAEWCGPCREAMPRWKALKDKYGRKGLRVVLVNTRDQDDPGRCRSFGWKPDELVCDSEGDISKRFGVGDSLPNAFLWSWQRELLVARGHIAEVESAVEALFRDLPRVQVVTEPGLPAGVADRVTEELASSGKMQVVASAADRERLRKARLAAASAHVSEDSRCELGQEIAPNMELKVSLGGKGSLLRLELFDIAHGCLVQSATADWDPRGVALSTRQAVERLVGKLRRPLVMPDGKVSSRRSSPRAPPPSQTANKAGADFDLPDEPETVVAEFDSVPAGAVVLVDGRVVCKSTPCTKAVVAGRHTVTMSVDMYDDARSDVNISRSKKQVRLTLEPAFGTVAVSTKPPGLPLFVDGKQAPAGNGDWQLEPGAHEIAVRGDCHVDTRERIVVEKGRRRTVVLEPPARLAGVKVTATDDRGNDMEATVSVDGSSRGVTPLTVKVPLCSREVVVRASDGRELRQALSLKEKQVVPVAVVFRSIIAGRGLPETKEPPRAGAPSAPPMVSEVPPERWAGARGPAAARFQGLEPKFREYQGLRFGASSNFKATFERKTRLSRELSEAYGAIVKMGDDLWSSAALLRRAQLPYLFGRALVESPSPRGLDADQEEMYRATLEQKAEEYDDEAKNWLAELLREARKARQDNVWLREAAVLYRQLAGREWSP